ncbi:glycosyltransferase [Microbacterium sp. YJN-G]|uniref:glycosyltransferase n=1 Tax=Microbacterium sp. YJN-G TaxID=2763257 RepID=UPI0018783C31|nr:glycosyltransferase [Microbacterium sp. YJN-G]
MREAQSDNIRGNLAGTGTGFIGLAVYRPSYELLARQIASIQKQTVCSWTCLIGIDGADMETRGIVDDLVGGDARFFVREYETNVGFYRNFERLLEGAPEGVSWVALSDQDDEWDPEKLERLLPGLAHADLVLGQVRVVDESRQDVGGVSARRSVSLASEFFDNQVTGSACAFRAQLLRIALPFPEATDLAFHDHWLGVCAASGAGFAVVDLPLQMYVQHQHNVIGEERRAGLMDRVARTRGRGRATSTGPWRYISQHRWGWRVNMARRLLQAPVELGRGNLEFVSAVAEGRFSAVLLRDMTTAVASRQAPLLRTLSLAIGSLHPSRFRRKR